MKFTPLILFISLAFHAPSLEAASAYHALERFASIRGSAAMAGIVQVRSSGQGIQPGDWIFSRMQGSAMLPAEIITASGGFRTGTTTMAAEGVPNHPRMIAFDSLNLDSDAALRIAKRKANSQFFSINRVDYSLSTNPLANVPAWTLTLYDTNKGKLGRITINATTGDILRPLSIFDFEVIGFAKDGEVIATAPEPFVDRAARSMNRWFKRSGDRFSRKTGRAISTAEEIATGDRTRNAELDVD